MMKRRRCILLIVALLVAVPVLLLGTDWMMVQRFEAAADTLRPGDPQSLVADRLGSTPYGEGVVAGDRHITADWYYPGPIAKARLFLADFADKRDWPTLHDRLQPPIRVVVEYEHGKIRNIFFGPLEEYAPSTSN